MTTPNRFIPGAIDLGEVKARADAKAQAESIAKSGGDTSASVVTITLENVEAELIKRSMSVPVIVLIGTPRSPDSEQLKADLTQLAQASANKFVFAYVNADTTPQVAQMFGIKGLPTVVALAAGEPIANFEGGQPFDALQQWTQAVVKATDGHLPGAMPGEEGQAEVPSDPRFDKAEEALNNGDFSAAIAAYDEILKTEPKNIQAQQARDNAKLLQRLQEHKDDQNPIGEADADPSNVEKAFAAADMEIAAGMPEKAFSRLNSLLAQSYGEEKTEIKNRLVELFALFEPTDPRVIAARTEMASALF